MYMPETKCDGTVLLLMLLFSAMNEYCDR